MQAFTSRDGQLFAEGVALSAIAERFAAFIQSLAATNSDG